MTDTPSKRYFDLKGDYTRAEINVQEADRPLVVTGPVAADASDATRIYALESSPAVKEISEDAYVNATDFSKLTVAQLDDRFAADDDYPAKGTKDEKVAFAKASAGATTTEEA